MEINFVRLKNPGEYSITRDGGSIFIATYNKIENTRELYSMDHVMVARAFCYYSKSLQLVPDYFIKLFTKDNSEVLIRPQSFTGHTYSFEFRGHQYFVISQVGSKYSIFKAYKQVALYQAVSGNAGHQNMLMVADKGLCLELFCLLALYLHSDFGSEYPSINPAFNATMKKARLNKNSKAS